MNVQAKRLQKQHSAAETRGERIEQAVAESDMTKAGRTIWLVPDFEPTPEETEYITYASRQALPEYYVRQALVPGLEESDIYDMMERVSDA